MRRRTGSERPTSWLVWSGAALLLGLWAGMGPLWGVVGVIALAALLVFVVIEPALALVVMLSLAPLKTLIATEAPLALPLDVGQLSFGVALAAWALWRVAQHPARALPRSPVAWALLVIMAAFAPSVFVAWSVGAWFSEMFKWVEMLALVVLVLDLGAGRRWQWLAHGILIAATAQALIGLYEYRGGSGAPHLWIAGYQNFRAFGTFGQPNPFSAFMGLTLPLALGMTWGYVSLAWTQWRGVAQRSRGRRERACQTWITTLLLAGWTGVCALLILAGLIASWGRGAWLGFAGAAVVMILFAPRQRWVGTLLFAGGGLAAITLWSAGLVPLSIQLRIDNALNEFTGFGDMRGMPISDENFAIVERLAHWQAAVVMADAYPLTGVGLGNYEAAYAEYGLPSWPRALGHAHNDYLNTLAETGVVGLTGYLLAWAAIVYWTIRSLRVADTLLRGMTLGLLGTWAHLAIHSVVDKLYVNNLFLHLGVMLGLLAVVMQRMRSVAAGEHTHDHI